MIDKIAKPFRKNRIDPKNAVPRDIIEQHPWHWDPGTQDHTDGKDAYVDNVKFEWEELAQWSIEHVNKYLVPDKYWYYDYKNNRPMHSADDVTDAPIYEQALLALKDNTHNQHNTQYFKIANEEFGEYWFPKLKKLFPQFKKDKLGISLFIQPPGHTIWSHVDTFSSFIRRTGDDRPNYRNLKRFMVFVRDWDWGHFFHMGNANLSQWKAGDLYNITPGVFHGSANAGLSPKITIHWSGEIE